MGKVSIVGTTTWGTTLGIVLARKGIPVCLWARTAPEAAELNRRREHRLSLPGVPFPTSLTVTSSLEQALDGAAMVILVVPAQSMRDNIHRVRPFLPPGALVISAAKGLEMDTGLRMSQVIASELPHPFLKDMGVLSGPNLAREIVQGLPAATVVAARDGETVATALEMLSADHLQAYPSRDVVGVELGGALKNIIAIAAGVVEGLGYGDNAKAALITRGLAEMISLGEACGAQRETFLGLAGVGDLVVTCASPLSRNHYVGTELAKGRSLKEIRASMREVAEGVPTAKAARELARRLGVRAPVAEHLYQVLYEGLEPRRAVEALLWDRDTVPQG